MNTRVQLTHEQVQGLVKTMAQHVLHVDSEHGLHRAPPDLKIYGVPRGGVPVAYLLKAELARIAPLKTTRVVDYVIGADIVVDDIYDSGRTRQRYLDYPFFTLISKVKLSELPHATFTEHAIAVPSTWVIFPWEGNQTGSADDVVVRLLQFIGEDPGREGLRETPARVLKAWQEWTAGYQQAPADVLKTFEDGAENVDELILVKDIPMWSHCEHHLAPFFGVAHIGYVPNGRIVGLSKLARLVDVFARRLQVQERLTNQIADAMDETLKPKGVGVVVEARHMCMESRGVRRTGATTVTSAVRGVLLTKPEARAEFMSLIKGR